MSTTEIGWSNLTLSPPLGGGRRVAPASRKRCQLGEIGRRTLSPPVGCTGASSTEYLSPTRFQGVLASNTWYLSQARLVQSNTMPFHRCRVLASSSWYRSQAQSREMRWPCNKQNPSESGAGAEFHRRVHAKRAGAKDRRNGPMSSLLAPDLHHVADANDAAEVRIHSHRCPRLGPCRAEDAELRRCCHMAPAIHRASRHLKPLDRPQPFGASGWCPKQLRKVLVKLPQLWNPRWRRLLLQTAQVHARDQRAHFAEVFVAANESPHGHLILAPALNREAQEQSCALLRNRQHRAIHKIQTLSA